MCATCGCSNETAGHAHSDSAVIHAHEHGEGSSHGHDHGRTVRLERDVLARNATLAEKNRVWFRERAILALNVVSSPGAGKTTLPLTG